MWAYFLNQKLYQIFDTKECTLRLVKIHIASRFGNVMKTQSGGRCKVKWFILGK